MIIVGLVVLELRSMITILLFTCGPSTPPKFHLTEIFPIHFFTVSPHQNFTGVFFTTLFTFFKKFASKTCSEDLCVPPELLTFSWH